MLKFVNTDNCDIRAENSSIAIMDSERNNSTTNSDDLKRTAKKDASV
jgi:hypothetical protein